MKNKIKDVELLDLMTSFSIPVKQILIDKNEIEIDIYLYKDFDVAKLTGTIKKKNFRNNKQLINNLNDLFILNRDNKSVSLFFDSNTRKKVITEYAELMYAYLQSISLIGEGNYE